MTMSRKCSSPTKHQISIVPSSWQWSTVQISQVICARPSRRRRLRRRLASTPRASAGNQNALREHVCANANLASAKMHPTQVGSFLHETSWLAQPHASFHTRPRWASMVLSWHQWLPAFASSWYEWSSRWGTHRASSELYVKVGIVVVWCHVAVRDSLCTWRCAERHQRRSRDLVRVCWCASSSGCSSLLVTLRFSHPMLRLLA